MKSLLISLALLSLVMIPFELKWPGVPNQRRFRRGWLLDLVYWFFTTLITKPVSKVGVAIVLFPVLWLSGAGSFAKLSEGFGPLGHQPRLDQAIQMIILTDFLGYWLHRWFHSQRLWRFHAIHHSSVDLDWLSAARVHPVNDIVNKALQAMAVITLGYSPLLLAGVLPFPNPKRVGPVTQPTVQPVVQPVAKDRHTSAPRPAVDVPDMEIPTFIRRQMD